MAYESSAIVGSGVSALREPGVQNVRSLRGSNAIVANYEDVNSLLGITQSSGLNVPASAVQLTGPTTRMRGRRKLIVQNLGAGALYIGGSNVTTANGVQVASGSMITLDVLDFGDIWAVSSANSDVRVLEMR